MTSDLPLLQYLHYKGLIRFNPETKLFEIDFAGIGNLALPSDVQSLMKLRLKGLKPEEIELLQIAACIGSRVTKYAQFDCCLILVCN
jgi:predicted ATPase